MTKAHAHALFGKTIPGTSGLSLELVCPADTLVALRSAVHNGADRIRIDHRWNGAALAFSRRDERHLLAKGIRHAHDHHCKVSLDLKTTEPATGWNADGDPFTARQGARHGTSLRGQSEHPLSMAAK